MSTSICSICKIHICPMICLIAYYCIITMVSSQFRHRSINSSRHRFITPSLHFHGAKNKKEGELTVTVIGEARRLQMFCFMACGADRKRPGEISPPGRAWHRYAGCKGERVGEGRKGATHMQKRAFSTHYIATLRAVSTTLRADSHSLTRSPPL